jgi:hypothetical protein
MLISLWRRALKGNGVEKTLRKKLKVLKQIVLNSHKRDLVALPALSLHSRRRQDTSGHARRAAKHPTQE